MIRLIRLDGVEFLLNTELIKTIERDKNTVITLKTGEKISVKNTESDVIQKIKALRIGRSETTNKNKKGSPQTN